jgi:hypothetical protein
MKEIKYTVSVRTFVILFYHLRFRFRYVEKLRFLQFRYRSSRKSEKISVFTDQYSFLR